MRTPTISHIAEARREGRICSHCGWMITKKDWKKGLKMCSGCRDALQGVNVKTASRMYLDEPAERTGEM